MQRLKVGHQSSDKVSVHPFDVPVHRVNIFDWLQGLALSIFEAVEYRKPLTHSTQALEGSAYHVSESCYRLCEQLTSTLAL